MKILAIQAKNLVTVLVGLFLICASGVANAAATVGECNKQIDAVQTVLGPVTITSKNADQTKAGLAKKLTGAKNKLDKGKFFDARQKLVDFYSKVDELHSARKPKIDLQDHDALIDAVNIAIACVDCLINPGNPSCTQFCPSPP